MVSLGACRAFAPGSVVRGNGDEQPPALPPNAIQGAFHARLHQRPSFDRRPFDDYRRLLSDGRRRGGELRRPLAASDDAAGGPAALGDRPGAARGAHALLVGGERPRPAPRLLRRRRRQDGLRRRRRRNPPPRRHQRDRPARRRPRRAARRGRRQDRRGGRQGRRLDRRNLALTGGHRVQTRRHHPRRQREFLRDARLQPRRDQGPQPQPLRHGRLPSLVRLSRLLGQAERRPVRRRQVPARRQGRQGSLDPGLLQPDHGRRRQGRQGRQVRHRHHRPGASRPRSRLQERGLRRFVGRDDDRRPRLQGHLRQRSHAPPADRQPRGLPQALAEFQPGDDRRHLHRHVPQEPGAPAPDAGRSVAPALPHRHLGRRLQVRVERQRRARCQGRLCRKRAGVGQRHRDPPQRRHAQGARPLAGDHRIQPRRHDRQRQREFLRHARLFAGRDSGQAPLDVRRAGLSRIARIPCLLGIAGPWRVPGRQVSAHR